MSSFHSMVRRRSGALLVVLMTCAMVAIPDSAEGIEIVVTTSPASPFCCGLASLSFTSTLRINSPEPAFFNQPYFFEVDTGAFNCNPDFNLSPLGTQYTGKNIGLGITQIVYQNYGHQPCEVAARSAASAWAGGYGLLPFVGAVRVSFCHYPCTCF